MKEDLIHFDIQQHRNSIIKVLGVGGGGSNAINYMYRQGIKDVDFVVCNTDAQALANSPVPIKIQLGNTLTEGRGAGNKPTVGREAAIENVQDIVDILEGNTKMVFITAGMGGGTGTGAAPIIAKAAKEMGLLTVGIVTLPFRWEGQIRLNQAIEGLNELKNHVDSLLVIHNEKLREIYGDLKISEAFSKADNILASAAKGIAEIITVHGYVNVDFADVQTVMQNSGVAIMGSATAEGENRAIDAIQQALNSPLLNNNDIKGAKNILLNITSGAEEATMDEVGIITDFVTSAVAKDSLMIWGTGFDASLENKLCVTIIATGFEANSIPELYNHKRTADRVPLSENPLKAQSGVRVSGKNKETHILQDSSSSGQRLIEFENLSTVNASLQQTNKESEKNDNFEITVKRSNAADSLNKMSKYQSKNNDISSGNFSDSSIVENLENQPAFIRKKIPGMNNQSSANSSSEEISRYSLVDDDAKMIKIRQENSYLHDNVD